MYGRTIRTALVATAVLATVLAVTVGATGRGKTDAILVKDICHAATWPLMPAKCLGGGSAGDVRMVGTVAGASQIMAHADITAEPPATRYSGKGDLLRRPENSSARYDVTVENRGDGISVVRRVQIDPQN